MTTESTDPHDLLDDRIAEALDARGVHQRGDLGFNDVVRAILSEAFERSTAQVPAYTDWNHPDNRDSHIRVYEVALDMPEDELSSLVAEFDKKWTYYTHIAPEEYSSCGSCGDDNYDVLSIYAENGKFTISHQLGCFGGEGLTEGSVEEALAFLRNAAELTGDDYKHRQLEELIADFEDIMDRDYMLP